MKLTLEGIKDRKVWEEAGISLPSYDVGAVAEATRKNLCGCTLARATFSAFLSAA